MASYRVKVDGKEYEVSLTDTAGGGARVTVEGRVFEVEPALQAGSAPQPAAAPVAAPRPAAPSPAPAAAATGGSGSIHAPIPGVVTRILVTVGDAVEPGQVVLKLEAMKMENDIIAGVGGTVKQVAVSEGTEVSDGQLMVVVE